MTLESWGKGKPDYYIPTIASRPVIVTTESEQVAWNQQRTYSIAGGAVAIDSFYTVPSGYTLSLGGGHIAVKDSCINVLRLVTPSTNLIGEFRFDVQGNLTMSGLAGQEITEGETLTAYIFNNDSIQSDFSLALSGVLSKS